MENFAIRFFSGYAMIKQPRKSFGKGRNSMGTSTKVQVGNVEVAISNLDKVAAGNKITFPFP